MAKFTCNFISYTLNRAIDISVVVPSVTMPEIYPGDGNPLTHDKEGKYPVIYLYHGLGNNHATWCGYANVEFFAEERNIAVVMISGENNRTVHSESNHVSLRANQHLTYNRSLGKPCDLSRL